jgi:hypothetical protein
MFDNLRDSASSSSFYEEESNDLYKEPASKPLASLGSLPRRRESRFLGMTAQQRFILSFMLMFTVCLLGTMAMLVLGKMGLF